MFHTRTRLAGALLFALLAAAARPVRGADDLPAAPPPRPVPTPPAPPGPPAPKGPIDGRSAEEVRGELDRLAREWSARKGAVEVAHQRFTAAAETLAKARARAADLPELAPKSVPPVHRAQDLEPALKAAQQIVESHEARAKALEAVAGAARSVLDRGADFERVSGPADAQRRAIESAARAAPDRGVPVGEVPAALAEKQLAADAERVRTAAAEVEAARGRAKAEREAAADAAARATADAAAARVKLDELKAESEATRAAFDFEGRVRGMTAPQLVDEFNRLSKLFGEKRGALRGDETDFAKAEPAVADARARLAAIKDPAPPDEGKPAAPLPPPDEAARRLTAAQQYLGARVRTAEERAARTDALVAALTEREQKAVAYATTLETARRAAVELAAVATEIEQRVGRGDLEPAKAPDLTADVPAAGTAARLTADIDAARRAADRCRAERDAARRPDPDAGPIRELTATLRDQITERLTLLTELRGAAAEYAAPPRERPEAEQKRIEQRAADRVAKEAAPWDRLLALDRSAPAAALADLLAAYYRELVELDERGDNLKRQQDALTALIAGTQKSAADAAKLRTVLERRSESPAAPDATGAEHRQWEGWLAGLLAPGGLKAEASIYYDELARLAAVGGANARRVQALSGNAPDPGRAADLAKQPAGGGEIGKARAELFEARVRGLATTGIKIGAVLLAALLLPVFVMRGLRRAVRGGTDDAGNPTPVLAPLRRALKAVVWAGAAAVILYVLGFDVTALVVALAIGGLAVAVAARPVTADVLGALAVFADRRFKVGDVVRVGGGDPARVVGLTWRSTALRNTNGQVVSVPNRQVMEAVVENLSRGTDTYDAVAVTISTDKDAGKVINVIRTAIGHCKNLAQDHGVTVLSYTQRGSVKVVQYRFWWFLKEYEARNKTRDEVFARIALGLAHEDMTGIELTLA